MGGANSTVCGGCPVREVFLEEAMLESYWGFDVNQEDNGGRAFPTSGRLWTQQDRQQKLRLQRWGNSIPEDLSHHVQQADGGAVTPSLPWIPGIWSFRQQIFSEDPLGIRHCCRPWDYRGHDRQVAGVWSSGDPGDGPVCIPSPAALHSEYVTSLKPQSSSGFSFLICKMGMSPSS